MDDLLPSYESATEQNPWLYIAEYLPSELLCSTALVCRKWHAIMTPYLWGRPASHFGVQNDTVYVALTRFKRILPYARPSVRALTHTLQFPPAHAEIYGGPHAEWLRDCLEYLPRLQCLIVDGLPFFDHAALLSMRYMSPRVRMVSPNRFPIYGLRLLDASRCSNSTSTGLAEALPHFPDLVSLDLSWTLAARDEAVLEKLQYLRNLRVLNLRGLGLKDSDFALIARIIGTRVRSLDVSGNNLTDASARLMLETCMKDSSSEQQVNRSPRARSHFLAMNNEPDIVEGDNLVVHLRNTLTRGFVGSLAIEDAPNVGITHLYITGNAITVEGISALLHSRRLQVLDIGAIPTVWENPSLTGEAGEQVRLPGVSKLMPILAENAGRMQYLRVNYELVTEDAPAEAVSTPRVELPSDSTPQYQPRIPELEAVEQPRIELDAIGSALQELHGDTSHPSELPAEEPLKSSTEEPCGRDTDHKSADLKLQRAPTVTVTPEPQTIEYDSAIAPEIISPSVTIDSAILSPGFPPDNQHHPVASSALDQEQSSGQLSPVSPLLGAMPEGSNTNRRSRHNSSHFVEDRRARLDLRQSTERRLHPGMLPKVRTLVITDVPTHTYDPRVIGRLIQYIKDAAEESSIARQRARYTYCLPPGRRRAIAEQEYTQNLFALQRIIFEMAAPRAPPKKVTSSWRAYPTKSSTEDADSEAFWEAATYDFSFFDDEECGLPRNEPGRTLPLTAMSGLELAQSDPMSARPVRAVAPERYLIDVVQEIAKFRKDRKAAYESVLQRGDIEPEVEGYWPGEITVIRKPMDDAGELDCYGNRYESGWYYR